MINTGHLKICLTCALFLTLYKGAVTSERHTNVVIQGDKFYINGIPTYEGRKWKTSYGGEYLVEGLLMNARLVQGIFDDLNDNTRGQLGI